MRNECNIIRDILPLYADKMVSADTASFVEEHLIGCAECRAELEKLKVTDVLRLPFRIRKMMTKSGSKLLQGRLTGKDILRYPYLRQFC